PRRPAGVLRTSVRARVVVADSENHGRARPRRRTGPDRGGYDLCLRLEPPEQLRHTRGFRIAAVSAADHRQRVARAISGARMASAPRWTPVRRSDAPGSCRYSDTMARARVRGAVVDHLCRGDAQ